MMFQINFSFFEKNLIDENKKIKCVDFADYFKSHKFKDRIFNTLRSNISNQLIVGSDIISWDKDEKGSRIKVNSNANTFIQEGKLFQCVLSKQSMSEGIHYIEIYVDRCNGELFLGFANENKFKTHRNFQIDYIYLLLLS